MFSQLCKHHNYEIVLGPSMLYNLPFKINSGKATLYAENNIEAIAKSHAWLADEVDKGNIGMLPLASAKLRIKDNPYSTIHQWHDLTNLRNQRGI